MIPDDEAPDHDDAAFLRAFDRLAGPTPDTRAGWADLRRRTPVPAPNRRAPRLAVLVAAAATVGFLGVVSRGADDDRPVLQPPAATTATAATASTTARPPSSVAPGASSAATVPAVVPSTSPISSARATPPTTVDVPAATDPTTGAGTTAPGARPTAVSSAARPAGPSAPPTSPPGADGTVAATSPSPVPAPPADPKTFAVTGGTIAVPLVGGRFGAPTVTAAPGWSFEVRKAEADRVEVRFRSSGRQSTTRLTLRGDGTVAVESG